MVVLDNILESILLMLIIGRALVQGVSDHDFFVFVATFVTSVKQLVHFFDFVATCVASV